MQVKDSASLYKTARKWSQVLTLKVSHGVEQTAVEKVLDQLCTSLTELEVTWLMGDVSIYPLCRIYSYM